MAPTGIGASSWNFDIGGLLFIWNSKTGLGQNCTYLSFRCTVGKTSFDKKWEDVLPGLELDFSTLK